MIMEKRIPEGVFGRWCQYLPDRDRMIAFLLYFGAPSLEEVLNLRVKDKLPDWTLNFPSYDLVLSFDLGVCLGDFCYGKKKEDLIFVNRYGKEITRTHLNQSFKRASRKANLPTITPSALMELKRIILE